MPISHFYTYENQFYDEKNRSRSFRNWIYHHDVNDTTIQDSIKHVLFPEVKYTFSRYQNQISSIFYFNSFRNPFTEIMRILQARYHIFPHHISKVKYRYHT